MALNQTPTSGFAGFPREIRDMVFAEVATAAGVRVCKANTSYVVLDVKEEYTGCIKVLHEWASRSHIANAACEELWVRSNFYCRWCDHSDVITRLSIPLRLKVRDGRGVRSEPIRLGTLINPGSYLRELDLAVDLRLDDPSYPNFEDKENLYKLGRELVNLARFPRLHKLRINVVIPIECDTYDKGMILVESLSQPCRELRRQLRTSFSVTLIRGYRVSWSEDDFIGPLNIGWMWDPPTYGPRASITAGLSDVEEHIRTLVGDVADPNERSTSLQTLRAAAAKLPQKREEILQMKDWSVGCGMSVEEWLFFKWANEQ